MNNSPSNRKSWLVAVVVAVVTAAVYWRVSGFGFINFDDTVYVANNPPVQHGLTWQGIRWAFTTNHDSNWFPLTWLSHMLDCQLFGLNPGAHHLVNVLFHVANMLLLFAVLKRMTGAPWRSLCVTALFALHPLRVESVAWISERKDVLSTCFWLLTMGAYVRYAERPGGGRYLAVVVLFALGLMSKPMLVSLPCVLLLLDYWPLGRTRWVGPARDGFAVADPKRLVLEKLPLFGLAIGSSVVTYWVQRGGGAMRTIKEMPLGLRAANAVLSYVRYLGKTVWPRNLAVVYPFSRDLPPANVAGAVLALVCLSAFAVYCAKRRPYVTMGWLWYLVTLVPVIGLVQVGLQSMADRYTYVPLIGIFIGLTWSVSEAERWKPYGRVAVGAAATLAICACAVMTCFQLRYWKDSVTLFRHALAATSGNFVAHNGLGFSLAQAGNIQEAIGHYQEALRIRPDYPEAHNNLGNALLQAGNVQEAIGHYQEALRIRPDDAGAHNDLGNALLRTGKPEEAIAQYEEALRLSPDDAEVQNNLGNALLQVGNVQEAIGHYQEALRISPDDAEAHHNLGIALVRVGKLNEAIGHYEQALRIRPDDSGVQNNLGNALLQAGNIQEAIGHYQEALRIRPDDAEVHNNLGNALMQAGRNQEAIGHYEQAIRIKPDYAEAHNNLGNALMQAGRNQEAIGHYEQAIRIKPDYAEAHSDLGIMLVRMSRVDDAIRQFQEALRLRPNDAELQYDLGLVLTQTGRFQEAAAHFQEALRIRPDYPEAHAALEQAAAKEH